MGSSGTDFATRLTAEHSTRPPTFHTSTPYPKRQSVQRSLDLAIVILVHLVENSKILIIFAKIHVELRVVCGRWIHDWGLTVHVNRQG